jgi:type II secretory pathway component GspD/PulD (secretin)
MNHEVTLQLEFEIRALSGTSLNGIPIISNQTLSQTVRLKEDEPAILGGLAEMERTRSISGLPGLAEIAGGAGHAFGGRSSLDQDQDLLIVVTPHRFRFAERISRRTFVGRGDPGANPLNERGTEAPVPSPRPEP